MRTVRIAHLASAALGAAILIGSAGAASAATCVGNCGILGPDGVVVAPPGSGSYRYISTYNGVAGVGQIDGVGGTDGSTFTSSVFNAASGDDLQFYFNYITSDGQADPSGTNYEDYTWVALQTDGGQLVDYIFTARTEPTGNIAPGLGLPGVGATLTPASVEIIGGAPDWSPLGPTFNKTCWGPGCGYTGWIRSNYTVQNSGSYRLVFGVTNFVDEVWDSGLAFDGIMIGNTPVDDDDQEWEDHHGAIPEPAAWAMMLVGFGGMGAVLRRRRALAV